LNNGIPSNPTYLKALRRLRALLTSAAEIKEAGKKFEVTVSEAVTEEKYVLKLS
jgi:hypothetical protein